MSDTILERTKVKFLGKPLKRLYKHHSVSRDKFVLFLDGEYPKRLGEDFNLSNLIVRCKQYADYPVLDIRRYYDEIHVKITAPEEKTDDAGE